MAWAVPFPTHFWKEKLGGLGLENEGRVLIHKVTIKTSNLFWLIYPSWQWNKDIIFRPNMTIYPIIIMDYASTPNLP